MGYLLITGPEGGKHMIMSQPVHWIVYAGASGFGSVVGWCASLAINQDTKFGVGQLSALIGAVAGAAVTTKFENDVFGAYCVALAVAFFLHRFLAYRPIREFIEREFAKEVS